MTTPTPLAVGRSGGPETPEFELSVVMPCLNEARTLETVIRKAQQSIDELGLRGEVIVADNGSTDGSQDIAERMGARVVDVPAKGYGSALIGGITAARGEFVIMGDADDSYDFTALGPFVEQLRAGHDMVLGNRFAGGISDGAMPPLHRYFGNPLITRIARRMFKSPAGDVYCGLRGFRKDAFDQLDLRSTGMEFALEMVVKATIYDLDVTEVPTTLAPDGRDRAPHLRTWRDGWRSLRFFLLYSPRWLFLYPGLLLMVLGVATMIAVAPGPFRIGGVAFDVHTMLYAGIAVLVGFQAVGFSISAKLFAITEGLLPEDPRLNRLFERVTLEVGLLVGGVLILAGAGLTIAAISIWGSRSFGELDYSETMRYVIPAGTLLALGFQTVLTSFFISILGLRRR
jgi:glycosyltransferase involved in cell wall biosynthesis